MNINIEKIEAGVIKPDDVLVVTLSRDNMPKSRWEQRVHTTYNDLKAVFPDNKVIVKSKEEELEVYRPETV